jgi:DNA-binding Lrp family transcriptional regulator
VGNGLLKDQDKKIIVKAIEEFFGSETEFLPVKKIITEEKIKRLLRKLENKGKIIGFLPEASYKKLHGLLYIEIEKGKDKRDVKLAKINNKTEEELTQRLKES